MLRFKMFVNEELNQAQKDKVNDWLPDKESGRIYSPKAEQISGHIIPHGQHSIVIPAVAHTMRDVKSHLENHGYHSHDYAGGTTTDKHGRVVSIGKALEKTKATDELKNNFANDDRQNAEDLEKHDIVISRHPYHVAEGSTNKPWKSCAGLTKTGRFCRYGGGAAARKMSQEIKHGTHAAYLVPKLKEGEESSNSFPDIQKRIDQAKARVYLKPHKSEDSGHEVLLPEDKVYQKSSTGAKNLGFLGTLKKFTDEHFPMNEGERYRKNQDVYDDDSTSNQIKINQSDSSVKKLLNNGSWNARHAIMSAKDLKPETLHHVIDHYQKEGDNESLASIAAHPNLNSSHIDRLMDMDIPRADHHLATRKNLSKNHIDRLVNRNDDSTHRNLLDNYNANLSKDQIHHIIGQALKSEHETIDRVKEKGFTPEQIDNVLYRSASHGILNRALDKKNADESHVDHIVNNTKSPALLSSLVSWNSNKLKNHHLEKMINDWKEKRDPTDENIPDYVSRAKGLLSDRDISSKEHLKQIMKHRYASDEKDKIDPYQVDRILQNPHSTHAHYELARTYKEGKIHLSPSQLKILQQRLGQ